MSEFGYAVTDALLTIAIVWGVVMVLAIPLAVVATIVERRKARIPTRCPLCRLPQPCDCLSDCFTVKPEA